MVGTAIVEGMTIPAMAVKSRFILVVIEER